MTTRHLKHKPRKAHDPAPAPGAAADTPHTVDEPRFAQPTPSGDPGSFLVPHTSDAAAYKILDSEGRAGELGPLPFPPARGGTEPVLTLAAVYGAHGADVEAKITAAGQMVFHAVGDTGNTRSTEPQNMVADKLTSDFDETDPREIPQFFLHLGDVIYSFGEAKYYHDQFYEPYRGYPAPILALAGNHDGIIAPGSGTPTLRAFLDNFCADTFIVTPDAGGLDRTAQIQPGVYFTLEAPMLRVLCLYSNALEDPGVISSQGGKFPQVGDVQLDYLRAALTRVHTDGFAGALIIAHHHPAYTAGSKHGWSPDMRAEIDAICTEVGVWPHAVLSAHAHNYQRFTRATQGRQTPYLIAGGGGHGVSKLVRKGGIALRVPQVIDDTDGDQVVLESYDDQDFGYLRILVTPTQLRIEYHPATDGETAKTPDDFVTVDLATHQLVHFGSPAPMTAGAPDPAPPRHHRRPRPPLTPPPRSEQPPSPDQATGRHAVRNRANARAR
jgi:hypothetical protein